MVPTQEISRIEAYDWSGGIAENHFLWIINPKVTVETQRTEKQYGCTDIIQNQLELTILGGVGL